MSRVAKERWRERNNAERGRATETWSAGEVCSEREPTGGGLTGESDVAERTHVSS